MKLSLKPSQLICWILIAVFSLETVVDPRLASAASPVVPVIPELVPKVFNPVLARGLKVHPENPMRFDLYLDTGSVGNQKADALREESDKLIKYFMAALTIPDKDQWVNLSPLDPDKIVDGAFGQTRMGRDLLAQDYILKKMSAAMTHPETEFGKAFWDKVYEETYAQTGSTDVPLEANHRIWIMPDSATVYESGTNVFILDKKMKVLLEDDVPSEITGLRKDNAEDPATAIGKKIAREILVPAVEKEVNSGSAFADLRQIYSAMILATWFKRRLKTSLLNTAYTDRRIVAGVDDVKGSDIEGVYDQYLDIYRQGVYNFIREEYDPVSQSIIPKKYFSGGFSRTDGRQMNMITLTPKDLPFSAVADASIGDQAVVPFMFEAPGINDAAMLSNRNKVRVIVAALLLGLLLWFANQKGLFSFFEAKPTPVLVQGKDVNADGEVKLRRILPASRIDPTQTREDGQDWDKVSSELGNMNENGIYVYSAVTSENMWEIADQKDVMVIQALPHIDVTKGNWTDPDAQGHRQQVQVGWTNDDQLKWYLDNMVYKNGHPRPSFGFLSLGNEPNHSLYQWKSAPVLADYFQGVVKNPDALVSFLKNQGFLDAQGNITPVFDGVYNEALLGLADAPDSTWFDQGRLIFNILQEMRARGEFYVLARQRTQWLHQYYPDLPVGLVWSNVPSEATLVLLKDIKIWGLNIYYTEVEGLWKFRQELMNLMSMGFDMKDHQIAITESGVSSLEGKVYQAAYDMNLYRQMEAFYRQFPDLFHIIGLFGKYDEYWKAERGSPAVQDPNIEEYFGAAEASGRFKPLGDSLKVNWQAEVWQAPKVPWYQDTEQARRAREIFLKNIRRVENQSALEGINAQAQGQILQYWINGNAAGLDFVRGASEAYVYGIKADRSLSRSERSNFKEMAENDRLRPEIAFKFDAAGKPQIMYFFTGLTLETVEAMDLQNKTIRRVNERGELTDTIGTFSYVDQNRVVQHVFGIERRTSVSEYLIEQRRYPSGALWRVFGVDKKGFTNLWYYPKETITENGVKVDGQVILGYPEIRERAVFYYIDHPDDPSRRYEIVDRFGKPLGADNMGNWAAIATTTPYLINFPESLRDLEKNRAPIITQLVDYKRNPIRYFIVDALSDQVLAEGEGVYDGSEYVRFLVDRNQINPELAKQSDQYGVYFFRLNGDVFEHVKDGDVSRDDVIFNSAEEMFGDLKDLPAYQSHESEIHQKVTESLRELSRQLTGNPERYTTFKLVRRIIQTPEGHQEYSYGILNDDYNGRSFLQVTTSGKVNFQSSLPDGFGPAVMPDIVVNTHFKNDNILTAMVFSHTGETYLRQTELESGQPVKYDWRKILLKEGVSNDIVKQIRDGGQAGIFTGKNFYRIVKYLLTPDSAVPVTVQYIGETDERTFVETTLGTTTFSYLSSSPAEFAKVPWRAVSQLITFDAKYKIPLGVTKFSYFDKLTGEYVSLMTGAVREEEILPYPVELRFDPMTGVVRRNFGKEQYAEATRNGVPVWITRGGEGKEALFSKPEVRTLTVNNQTYLMISETTVSATRREEERSAIYLMDKNGQFQWYATYLQDPNTGDDRWDIQRYETLENERGFNSLVPSRKKSQLNDLKSSLLKAGTKIDIKNIQFPSTVYVDLFRLGEQYFYVIVAGLSILAILGGAVVNKRRARKEKSIYGSNDKAMLGDRLTPELERVFAVAATLRGRLVIPKHVPSVEQPEKRKEFLEYYLRGYGIAESDLNTVIGLYESGQYNYLFEDEPENIRGRPKALDISAESFASDLQKAEASGYHHALVIQGLIRDGQVTVQDAQNHLPTLTRVYERDNPGLKPARGVLWDWLSTALVHQAQNQFLDLIKNGNESDIRTAVRRLPQTPETRVLTELMENNVLSMSDIVRLARQTGERGEQEFTSFPLFVDYLLKEKVIGKIYDNVLRQMGMEFVYDPSNESSDKRLVLGTIYARAHTKIFRNPQVLKSLANGKLETDPLADITYNPYQFNDFIETSQVRVLIINSLLKVNPSQTKNLSFGGGSLMATYLVYASLEIEKVLQQEIGSAKQILPSRLGEIHAKIQALDKSYGALLIAMMKDGRKFETDVDGRKAFESVTERDESQYQRLFEVFADQQIFNLFAWMVRDGLKFGELAQAFDQKMDKETIDQDDPQKVLKDRLNGFRFSKITTSYSEETFAIDLEKYVTAANPQLRQQFYAAMQLIYMDQFEKHDPEASKAFENTQKLHTSNRLATFSQNVLNRFKSEILVVGLAAQALVPIVFGISPFTLALGVVFGFYLSSFIGGSPAGVALKQILWDHYLKIFGGLEKFWNVKSPTTRMLIHYGSIGTLVGGFGLALAASFGFAPVLGLHTWAYLLLATVPSVLLPIIFADSKVVSKNSKWYWGSVIGLTTAFLFGLLPHHLFPYVSSFPIGKFQTWITLFLILITVMPTVTSMGQVMSFKKSYQLGQQQLWNLSAKAIAGLQSFDPRRINQKWFWKKKFSEIYEESLKEEDLHGFITPNKEPLASYLKRTVNSLRAKMLITDDEYQSWLKALRHEVGGEFVLPKSKEAAVIVRDVMKGLSLKKPIADPVALIEPTSTHVQAAWETFSYSGANFMLNGTFNSDPKTGKLSNPAGYMMHRLVEWQDVVGRMRDKFQGENPEYKDIFDRLASADEYTDLVGILYAEDKLKPEHFLEMDKMVRLFLNEHMMSNRSVIHSMSQDVLEYHINIARQTGDWAYAEAVTELSQVENFVSLKKTYEALKSQYSRLSGVEKTFVERYPEYQKFTKTKLRHMLHVEPLWRTFQFDANRNIVKAPPVDDFRAGLKVLREKLDGMESFANNPRDKEELNRLIGVILNRKSIQSYEMHVEKWAALVRDENALANQDNDDPRNIMRMIYLMKKHVADQKLVNGIVDNWNKIEELAIYLNAAVDNDVIYSLYSPSDSVIERNKNGGMSHNLWLFFETTFNYDAFNRPTYGSNIWRPLLAATMGRNPHIAVINPKMRVWEAASEIWPGMSIYAISQESFTGPVQRGQFEGTSFYGKGIGRTEIIVSLVSAPGEDTASFLEAQRMQPLNTSTWTGYYQYIWGRPSLLIESMIGTETRYSFNSIRLVMDPGQHGVMFNKNLGFDKKLSHYFFFLHYMNSFNVMMLLTVFPALVGMSHLQYLTPFWFFAFTSTFLMQAINLMDFMRHWEDTGSFWVAAAKTLWDIIRGFGFYVTLLPNFLIGKILAGNEIFSFIRTRKDALLGGWNDLEKFKETMMVDFHAKFREGMPLKGLIGLLGILGFFIGAFMMHGKGIGLIAIYGLASVAVLTGSYVYGAFGRKDGRLKGMDMLQLFTKVPLVASLTLQYMWPIVDRLMGGSKYLSRLEQWLRLNTSIKTLSPYQFGLRLGVERNWSMPLLANAMWYTLGSAMFISGWLFMGFSTVHLFFGGALMLAIGMFIGGLVGGVTVRSGKFKQDALAPLVADLNDRQALLDELVEKKYLTRNYSLEKGKNNAGDEYALSPDFLDLKNASGLDISEQFGITRGQVYRLLSSYRNNNIVNLPKLDTEVEWKKREDVAKILIVREKAQAIVDVWKKEAKARKTFSNISASEWEGLRSLLEGLLKHVDDGKSKGVMEREIALILTKAGIEGDLKNTLESFQQDVENIDNQQVLSQLNFMNGELKGMAERIDVLAAKVVAQKAKKSTTDHASLTQVDPGGIIMDGSVLNLNNTSSGSVPVIQSVLPGLNGPFKRLDYIILDIRPITSVELLGRLQESTDTVAPISPEVQNIAALQKT